MTYTYIHKNITKVEMCVTHNEKSNLTNYQENGI